MINKAINGGGGGATGIRLYIEVDCNYCNVCIFTSVLITMLVFIAY